MENIYIIAAMKVKALCLAGMNREEASKAVSEAMNRKEDYASAVKAIRAVRSHKDHAGLCNHF